jgi:hypothetical protein
METLTVNLFILGFLVCLADVLLTIRYLPLPVSIIVSLIKSIVRVIYFAYYYDGTWSHLDDLSYNHGQ